MSYCQAISREASAMMGKVRFVEATSLISEIQASCEERSLADLGGRLGLSRRI